MKKQDVLNFLEDWKLFMAENGGDRMCSATLLLAYHTKRLADQNEPPVEIQDPTFDSHPEDKRTKHKTKM